MEATLKRNFILLGHAQAGKTTLAESILHLCKMTSRKGLVSDGTTTSDYNLDEIERKHSINSSLLFCNFKNHRIQIIDSPGYADFIGEVYASLRAVDSAVIVVDGVHSIEVGTERVWGFVEEMQIPCFFFINKSDKPDANCDKALADIKQQFSKNAIFINDLASSPLIEAVAESDDKLLERYLEGTVFSEQEIKESLRRAVLERKVFPVFYGSALEDKSVIELMDAAISYFPNPLEHPKLKAFDTATKAEKDISPSENDFLSGFVFKSISDPYVGQLSLIRIFSGKLLPNTGFYNTLKGLKERIGQIYIMQGKDQCPIEEASCGDIIAISKLKDTTTSDTISDEKNLVQFAPILELEPAISASVKPKTRADEERISQALHKLQAEDPTFRVSRDPETKEMIISGMGDVHLDIMVERMRRRFNVEVDLTTPKVAYKETITKPAKAQGKYKRQSGGRGQYGDCWIEISPLPRGKGFEFVDKIYGGAIPRNFIPSVEKGVRQAYSEGAIAGYPIVDIKVILVDGSYHEVDSSDMAFQIAGAMALRKAVHEANPVLLEPIMDAEVAIPEEYMGHISGDLNSRRGRIMGMEPKGRLQLIKAFVPQAEMFKYANALRSMTQGRGSYSMKFSHYEEVPSKIAAGIIAVSGFHKKEEE